jgi:hypothetical protein
MSGRGGPHFFFFFFFFFSLNKTEKKQKLKKPLPVLVRMWRIRRMRAGVRAPGVRVDRSMNPEIS